MTPERTGPESTGPERLGLGWQLWVLGWSLLVGSTVFVVPGYFLFGASGAVWVAGAVLLCCICLAWLSAEAGRALDVEEQRVARGSASQRVASKGLHG